VGRPLAGIKRSAASHPAKGLAAGDAEPLA